MTTMISGEVFKYRASIFTGKINHRAFIFLETENASVYINFYSEGTTLQENQSPVVNGNQHVYLYHYYSDYPNMLDLLRNEKPINFFYRDDARVGYLTTSKEPIGEGEQNRFGI